MAKILDSREAESVAYDVIQTLDDCGYPVEEAIPGLIQAIVKLANGNDQILDEAANLLADGGAF